MLVLNNAEGSKFNGNLDNYLVVSLVDQSMHEICYEQLEWIVEVTEGFHTEPLVIEADDATANIVDYLINIDKLECLSRKEISTGTYYTVQALN